MSEIKLDWDDITREEAFKRSERIFSIYFVHSIRLYQSSTSGYHAEVSLEGFISDKLATGLHYRLRRAWKDDGKRIVTDMLFRDDKTPKDILFTTKTIGGLQWYRVHLRTWTK